MNSFAALESNKPNHPVFTSRSAKENEEASGKRDLIVRFIPVQMRAATDS
jgi:hypothetical protein